MKKVCALLLASGMTAFSGATLAADETHNYIGVAAVSVEQGDRYGVESLGVSNGDPIFETQDVMVKFGGKVNRYFGVELRAGASAAETEESKAYVGGEGDFSYKHDYWAGGYLRFQFPVSFIVPYAQVGVIHVKESFALNAPNGGQRLLASSNSFQDTSMAAGVEMNLLGRLSINGEYFLLSDKNPGAYVTGDPALISTMTGGTSTEVFREDSSVRRSGFSVGLSWHF